jgi:hypothetical protein
MVPKVPFNLPITLIRATRAESGEALLNPGCGPSTRPTANAISR